MGLKLVFEVHDGALGEGGKVIVPKSQISLEFSEEALRALTTVKARRDAVNGAMGVTHGQLTTLTQEFMDAKAEPEAVIRAACVVLCRALVDALADYCAPREAEPETMGPRYGER
jgi:hypothetical protein